MMIVFSGWNHVTRNNFSSAQLYRKFIVNFIIDYQLYYNNCSFTKGRFKFKNSVIDYYKAIVTYTINCGIFYIPQTNSILLDLIV